MKQLPLVVLMGVLFLALPHARAQIPPVWTATPQCAFDTSPMTWIQMAGPSPDLYAGFYKCPNGEWIWMWQAIKAFERIGSAYKYDKDVGYQNPVIVNGPVFQISNMGNRMYADTAVNQGGITWADNVGNVFGSAATYSDKLYGWVRLIDILTQGAAAQSTWQARSLKFVGYSQMESSLANYLSGKVVADIPPFFDPTKPDNGRPLPNGTTGGTGGTTNTNCSAGQVKNAEGVCVDKTDEGSSCSLIDIPCNFRYLFIPDNDWLQNKLNDTDIGVNGSFVPIQIVDDITLGTFKVYPTNVQFQAKLNFNFFKPTEMFTDMMRFLAWWAAFFWALNYLGFPVIASMKGGALLEDREKASRMGRSISKGMGGR